MRPQTQPRLSVPVANGDRREYAPQPTAPADAGLPTLLSVKRASELLGVDESTIYRWARGRLRSAAVEIADGTLRLDAVRIKRFIEAHRRG